MILPLLDSISLETQLKEIHPAPGTQAIKMTWKKEAETTKNTTLTLSASDNQIIVIPPKTKHNNNPPPLIKRGNGTSIIQRSDFPLKTSIYMGFSSQPHLPGGGYEDHH